VYWQPNLHAAPFHTLRMKIWKEVFHHRELNPNAAQPRRDNDMPQNKPPIKRITKNLRLEIKTWPSGVQCQKRSYRITLFGVWRDLATSQTKSIMISISVISTMQNTFGTTQ
jgi:hypothetical protein